MNLWVLVQLQLRTNTTVFQQFPAQVRVTTRFLFSHGSLLLLFAIIGGYPRGIRSYECGDHLRQITDRCAHAL